MNLDMPTSFPEALPVGELLRDARPVLSRVLTRFRVPPEDAEDLLQNALLQFLKKREEIRDPRKWLTGAVRNECLFYWRTRSRRLDQAVDTSILELLADDDVAARQERRLLLDRLREMIATLGARCRKILELRYRLGYDNAEIAGATGYKTSSVDKTARRCLAALRSKLVATSVFGKSPNV